MFGMKADVGEVKDTLASVRDLISPIVEEVEGEEEMKRLREENDYLDVLHDDTKRSDEIEAKKEIAEETATAESQIYNAGYRAKIETRCEEQLSRGSEKCRQAYSPFFLTPNISEFRIQWISCFLYDGERSMPISSIEHFIFSKKKSKFVEIDEIARKIIFVARLKKVIGTNVLDCLSMWNISSIPKAKKWKMLQFNEKFLSFL